MVMQKVFRVTVDINKKIPAPAFEVNTNDLKSVKLEITITNGQSLLDLTDVTPRINIRKPDNEVIFQDCEIVDAATGKVQIVLENQAYLVPGTHTAEIACYKGTEITAITGTFSYKSIKGIMNDQAVESKSEFTAIDRKIAEARKLLEDIGENGVGVDEQARQEIQEVTAQLAETVDKTYTKHVNTLRNIVTFYFDDAPKADLTVLKPMADARGVPLSICAIVEYVKNSPSYMDIDELKMLEEHGWSVESHTYTHPRLDTLTEEQLEYEFRESKKFFNENGMFPAGLCYPEGRYNEKVLRIMRKYYDSGLASVQGKNTSPVKQFALRRILVDEYTIEQLKAMVDGMKNEWYIFYSHNTNAFVTKFKVKFEQLMDYVIEKQIDVLNFRDALQVFRNRIDVGDDESSTFKVGADGKVDAGNLNYHYLGRNSGMKNTTPITEFPRYKVSIAAFNMAENSGIPYANGIGTLITYRIHEDDTLSYQEFIPYNANARYTRRWVSGAWGEWVNLTSTGGGGGTEGPVTLLSPATTTITKDTPIANFPSRKISYITFLGSQSDFPFSNGIGTLMTAKLSDEWTLSYQIFYEYNSNKWHRRRWMSASAGWGTWVTYSGDVARIQTVQVVNFGTIPENSNANFTVTLQGLQAEKAVSVSLLAPIAGLILQPYITAANTLVINAINTTSSPMAINGRGVAVTQ